MLRQDNSGLLWAGHTHVIWILTLQRDSAVNQPATSNFHFFCSVVLISLLVSSGLSSIPTANGIWRQSKIFDNLSRSNEICMFYQLIFCRFDSGTKHFLINAQLSQLMSCEALSNPRHAFKGKQLNWNYWNVDKTCSSHWNQPREIVKLLSSLLSSVTGKSDRHKLQLKG